MTDPQLSETDVARYWNDNADGWAAEVRQGHDVAREGLNNPTFLPFVGDVRGRRVLDAGCGEGDNTRLLARQGARMTGVDLSDRMIALAEEDERCAPLGIRYVNTSYAELGMFDEAVFDAVVSFMALMDGPRFDRTLSDSLNGMLEAGFALRRIAEPRPSEEYCAAHPSQRGWRDHVAGFLHIRAEKP